MRVTLLGCGGSGGVPVLGRDGPDWGACDPGEPRNRRRRVSVLVEGEGGRRLVIDTAPDFREQMLPFGADGLDAVVFTHAHADHTHGLDDLRGVCRVVGRPIAIWADPPTLEDLTQRFAYAFTPILGSHYYKPQLAPQPILGPFEAAGLLVTPFRQDHGFGMHTLGLRIGGFAYSTDVVSLDDAAFAVLEGIDTWIVDCVREAPHPTHSHLAQTLAWIARVRPRRAILTHMNETMDYRTVAARCPPGVEPGYDGLSFTL